MYKSSIPSLPNDTSFLIWESFVYKSLFENFLLIFATSEDEELEELSDSSDESDESDD